MNTNNELKVALIQSDLVWENPVENRCHFHEKIKALSETIHLVILPEMFTTGFTMNAKNLAESMDGDTVLWMKKMAKIKNIAIAGSIIVLENTQYYNRFLFIYPSGEINFYDKHHTFTLAGESNVFSAGQQKIIITYKGWKICPLICYDLRFPVWARNKENYDVLLYVASWPSPRIQAWDTLLKARAIENMSYTIGVNRVGEDFNKYLYTGHSSAFDSLGNELCKSIDKETVLIVTLNKKNQQKIRDKFRFLEDIDFFNIPPSV